jgi:SAM-dependent methyltransferase
MSDWRSYDSAAATHAALGVPAMFERPARELAARMEFAAAVSVLDVGTGSGAVAGLAGARAVGVDPSFEMVKAARANGIARVAVARAPGLPFADGAFDRVTAGFVLSHVPSYEASLADMVRVTRIGGMVGATAWGNRSTPYRDCWDGILARFVDADRLKAALAEFLPWEEWLGDARRLRAALEGAGLREVRVDEIDVPVHVTIEEFLAIRDASGPARFLRTQVDEAEWERFRRTTREEFAERFRDPIDHVRVALIGVGRRDAETQRLKRMEES